jgi:DNA-binding MarR family transcriptional regulator
VELILLGRTLTKLGEEMLRASGSGAAAGGERVVVIVMSDVYENPGTTVGEVARRTGLPQSAVSAAVARLREAGSVRGEPDPADRRRQLLRRDPTVTPRRRAVAALDVERTIVAALGTHEPSDAAEVLAALEVLAGRLTPETIGRLRSEPDR